MERNGDKETSLFLGGVNVDINQVRPHGQRQVHKGMCVARQELAVNGVNGLLDGVALDKAIVDEEDELELFHIVVGIRNQS